MVPTAERPNVDVLVVYVAFLAATALAPLAGGSRRHNERRPTRHAPMRAVGDVALRGGEEAEGGSMVGQSTAGPPAFSPVGQQWGGGPSRVLRAPTSRTLVMAPDESRSHRRPADSPFSDMFPP